MLDRILNINPQEKYKSGLKVNTHNYAVNRSDHEKHHSKDSALFSPLAQLMSKINWRILNIEFPSEDEMLFNFLVGNLEFITVINFTEMYNNIMQEFAILNVSNDNSRRIHTEVKLKVEKQKISVLETPDPIVTDNLSLLFEKILSSDQIASGNISDRHILNDFLFGIEYGLNRELNYILKVIYTFISTRNKSKVKNNFILKTRENNPIIMQKVVRIYAE